MIIKILTIVVFIAELIVAYTLVKGILTFDKRVLELNETVISIKPGLKDIGYLIKKISAQCVDFSYEIVSKIKKKRDESIINQLNKLLIALLLLRINSKFIKKLRHSKLLKGLKKGLSILQIVI